MDLVAALAEYEAALAEPNTSIRNLSLDLATAPWRQYRRVSQDKLTSPFGFLDKYDEVAIANQHAVLQLFGLSLSVLQEPPSAGWSKKGRSKDNWGFNNSRFRVMGHKYKRDELSPAWRNGIRLLWSIERFSMLEDNDVDELLLLGLRPLFFADLKIAQTVVQECVGDALPPPLAWRSKIF